jgi:hypothetical protein
MSDIDSFKEKLQSLISKFEKDKTHYVSKGYPEAQVRVDFLNPCFDAPLPSDTNNKLMFNKQEPNSVIIGFI